MKRTFDVYWYTRGSRVIRVKAESEKEALEDVRIDGEDAGRLIDDNQETDGMEVVEVKE